MAMKTVGIFSREGEINYRWLIQFLLTFIAIGGVHPFYISNNNFQLFREKVSECTFAILYHSKKRGRVNVCDVLDALYDEQLQYLSEKLGRENVMVVIDDLDVSNGEEKIRIEELQPSIKRLARELFIFSMEEKKNITENYPENEKLLQIKEIIMYQAAAHQQYGTLIRNESQNRGPFASQIQERNTSQKFWLNSRIIQIGVALLIAALLVTLIVVIVKYI